MSGVTDLHQAGQLFLSRFSDNELELLALFLSEYSDRSSCPDAHKKLFYDLSEFSGKYVRSNFPSQAVFDLLHLAIYNKYGCANVIDIGDNEVISYQEYSTIVDHTDRVKFLMFEWQKRGPINRGYWAYNSNASNARISHHAAVRFRERFLKPRFPNAKFPADKVREFLRFSFGRAIKVNLSQKQRFRKVLKHKMQKAEYFHDAEWELRFVVVRDANSTASIVTVEPAPRKKLKKNKGNAKSHLPGWYKRYLGKNKRIPPQ